MDADCASAAAKSSGFSGEERWGTMLREIAWRNVRAKREDLTILICQYNAMHRRDVVCGGGAAVFSAIIATLLGSSKPVKAEAISGSVPELDFVAVRVLVDSYQFAVAPSRKIAGVMDTPIEIGNLALSLPWFARRKPARPPFVGGNASVTVGNS